MQPDSGTTLDQVARVSSQDIAACTERLRKLEGVREVKVVTRDRDDVARS